ncbi:B3 domain-containing protein Os01g0723500 [Amborella trichopoda]|uniref:TF-B3 domain-containing protein n=1 Tax=Amborella trichopoda TaxID=13333 RepID=W1P1U6_AMBTC|nr:B3 domain-containing protein Os01g0723500 [Amborella trichopoda]ERN03807.1 hypothetical protein AMTR_s00078p00115450 [Amborella trichopoda]|eukprot:XP_006842132.1 B3 domain-containing protein Os01g0723500 [Amborella trichopoda]
MEDDRTCLKCELHCHKQDPFQECRTRPHFLVALVGNFSNVLALPLELNAHIKEEISENAILVSPSGKIWLVGLNKTKDCAFLQKGWSDFVKGHSLEKGEHLVLRYDGGLRFAVKIFDTNGCHRGEAVHKAIEQSINVSESKSRKILSTMKCLVKRKSSPNEEEEQEQGIDTCIEGKINACEESSKENHHEENTLMISHSSLHKISCQDTDAQNRSIILSDKEVVPSRTNYYTPKKKYYTPKKKERMTKVGSDTSKNRYFLSNRRMVTQDERERAVKAANLFESSSPYFIMVMKTSHVYKGFLLNIPLDFVKKHLPDEKPAMDLLDPSGKKWKVKYIVSGGFRGGLSGGWGAVSLGNNLEEGDACVFELKGDNFMVLHIFRVVEEIVPLTKYPASTSERKRKLWA